VRKNWEAVHRAELAAAGEAARKAAGLPAGDPRAARLDVAPFLPPALRDSVPVVPEAVTVVQGTAVCDRCFPGQPGQPAARPQLLVAQGALSPTVMSQLC